MKPFIFATLASILVSFACGFCRSDPGTREEIEGAEAHFRTTVLYKGVRIANAERTTCVAVSVHWNVFYDQTNPNDGNIS
jgi:hypothetical protein